MTAGSKRMCISRCPVGSVCSMLMDTEDVAGLMPVASRQRFTKALAAELQGFRTIPSRPLRVDALVEEADNIYRLLPLLFLACFREGRLLSRTVCFL